MESIPFDVSVLPPTIQRHYQLAIVDDSYEDLLESLRKCLVENSERRPELLCCLAFAHLKLAQTLMVDDLYESCKTALALLHEARLLGACLGLIEEFRADVRMTISQLQHERAQTLKLRERPIESLDYVEASDLAHLLEDLGGPDNYRLASKLWRHAKQRWKPDTEDSDEDEQTALFCNAEIAQGRAGDLRNSQASLEEMINNKLHWHDDVYAPFYQQAALSVYIGKAVTNEDKALLIYWFNKAISVRKAHFPHQKLRFDSGLHKKLKSLAQKLGLHEISDYFEN